MNNLFYLKSMYGNAYCSTGGVFWDARSESHDSINYFKVVFSG